MSEKWEVAEYQCNGEVWAEVSENCIPLFELHEVKYAHQIVTDHNLMGEVRECLEELVEDMELDELDGEAWYATSCCIETGKKMRALLTKLQE